MWKNNDLKCTEFNKHHEFKEFRKPKAKFMHRKTNLTHFFVDLLKIDLDKKILKVIILWKNIIYHIWWNKDKYQGYFSTEIFNKINEMTFTMLKNVAQIWAQNEQKHPSNEGEIKIVSVNYNWGNL